VLRIIILIQLVTATCLVHAQSHVCFEAESSTNIVPLMQIGGPEIAVTNKAWTTTTGASGNRYIDVPQSPVTNIAEKADSKAKSKPEKVIPGSASFEFDVSEAGPHQLWCLVWWFDSCGNSASISIDGAKPFSFGQDRTYKRWHWIKAPPRLKQLNLKKGRHKMVFSVREDGIRIDQILITNDEDFVPVGIEDVTKPPKGKDE
jgi:hypothetical protein